MNIQKKTENAKKHGDGNLIGLWFVNALKKFHLRESFLGEKGKML
jgi:hypothetical protein